MKILLLDNYDSFTWNLFHYIEPFVPQTEVIRNDLIDVPACAKYDAIVFSPGPGLPQYAGNMPEIISAYAGKKPILGVCLGMQAIAQYAGAEIYNMHEVVHGLAKNCRITNRNDILFKNLPQEFKVGRYHSWAVNPTRLPSEYIISSEDEKGIPMSFFNREKKINAVQFHPESILTSYGKEIIKNWIESFTI